jgi:hypothetical protein
VSYNILADLYADSEVSRTQLYPYCPPYALSIDYRKQLVLKELLGELCSSTGSSHIAKRILHKTATDQCSIVISPPASYLQGSRVVSCLKH